MTIPTNRALWKSFLETTPPNTSITIPQLVEEGTVIHNPCVKLHCKHDDGLRRFDAADNLYQVRKNRFHFIRYRCRDCGTTQKTIAILVECSTTSDDVQVMKLGEFPPFSAPVSSRIQKLLSRSDLELYRKGARAEAQGLGIGAATYFRRIVEEQWRSLVKEIRRAAERLGATDLGVYDAALEKKQFSRAVEMLKDIIPEKLLILDGQNPLTLLHMPLSQQLHQLTDEECLQQAADIRVVLTVLLENIADVLKNQDELQEAAKRLRSKPSTGEKA